MADRYVFADEAGNFDFSIQPGASRYFILATVTLDDCRAGERILELRRQLAWQGTSLSDVLHATTDVQSVRDEVFQALAAENFRVDATILEKRKALPRLYVDEWYFYQMAWYLHFKFVAPRIVGPADRLLVTAASLGTKKKKANFHNAVQRVVQQVAPVAHHQVAFWPYESDPCLQLADYCTWAIQRKWELGDPRSHVLIANKIRTEFDVWQIGQTYHY